MTPEEGENFAKTHGCLFVETSAKTDVAVTQAFEELVLKVRADSIVAGVAFAWLWGPVIMLFGAGIAHSLLERPWDAVLPVHHVGDLSYVQVLETPNLLTDAGNSRLHVGAGIQQPAAGCCG